MSLEPLIHETVIYSIWSFVSYLSKNVYFICFTRIILFLCTVENGHSHSIYLVHKTLSNFGEAISLSDCNILNGIKSRNFDGFVSIIIITIFVIIIIVIIIIMIIIMIITVIIINIIIIIIISFFFSIGLLNSNLQIMSSSA